MMNKEVVERKKRYQCKECGLWYPAKELAKECEAFCKKYKSCSLEITKHAVKNQQQKFGS